MSSFSFYEKKIINELIKLEDEMDFIFLQNIPIETIGIEKNTCIEVTNNNNKIEIKLYVQEKKLGIVEYNKKISETERNLTQFLYFIKYLIEKRYLLKIKNEKLTYIGNDSVITNNTPTNITESNPLLKNLIQKYGRHSYFISNELKKISRNNFRSQEENYREEQINQLKEQSIYSKRNITILTCTLIASLVFNIYHITLLKLDFKTPKKIKIEDLEQKAFVKLKQLSDKNNSIFNKQQLKLQEISNTLIKLQENQPVININKCHQNSNKDLFIK